MDRRESDAINTQLPTYKMGSLTQTTSKSTYHSLWKITNNMVFCTQTNKTPHGNILIALKDAQCFKKY